jgi:hypothetical protein
MTDIQDSNVVVKRSISRKVAQGTLVGLILLFVLSALAIALNAVLLRFFGGVQQWQEWRIDHYWHLLAWRLTLYTGLTVIWFKLKARLPEQAVKQNRKRLLRVQVLVVLLVLLIELSKLMFQPGGEL